jgi:S-formylglutathione hydrolase FrmB
MVRRKLIVLTGFLIFLLSFAQAQTRIDCNGFKSHILNQTVHYCVLLPGDYDAGNAKLRRYPVLYFLHGLGQDERTLFDTGGWNLIEDLRQQHKIGDFLIVSPEGRRSFYVNSSDGKVRYSDFFLQEFMPQIETRYRVSQGRQNRGITGVSMGGYGALRFAFAHPELFSSVSAQSAALMTDTPQELNAAMRAGTNIGTLLGPVFGDPINLAHWQSNSPFVLATQHAARLRTLAIYFNCGQQDEYGFEKGAAALHQELSAEGIQHEYHLYPGDHSLPYFVEHMGETLEFHSRVFAEHK